MPSGWRYPGREIQQPWRQARQGDCLEYGGGWGEAKSKPKSWALVPWLLWAQRAAGPLAAHPAPGHSRLTLELGKLFSAAAFEIRLPGHNPGSVHSQLGK